MYTFFLYLQLNWIILFLIKMLQHQKKSCDDLLSCEEFFQMYEWIDYAKNITTEFKQSKFEDCDQDEDEQLTYAE